MQSSVCILEEGPVEEETVPMEVEEMTQSRTATKKATHRIQILFLLAEEGVRQSKQDFLKASLGGDVEIEPQQQQQPRRLRI